MFFRGSVRRCCVIFTTTIENRPVSVVPIVSPTSTFHPMVDGLRPLFVDQDACRGNRKRHSYAPARVYSAPQARDAVMTFDRFDVTYTVHLVSGIQLCVLVGTAALAR